MTILSLYESAQQVNTQLAYIYHTVRPKPQKYMKFKNNVAPSVDFGKTSSGYRVYFEGKVLREVQGGHLGTWIFSLVFSCFHNDVFTVHKNVVIVFKISQTFKMYCAILPTICFSLETLIMSLRNENKDLFMWDVPQDRWRKFGTTLVRSKTKMFTDLHLTYTV